MAHRDIVIERAGPFANSAEVCADETEIGAYDTAQTFSDHVEEAEPARVETEDAGDRKPNDVASETGSPAALSSLPRIGAYDPKDFGPYDPVDQRPARSYADFDRAYQFISQTFFNNALPACQITFQRKRDSFGYFARDRFANASDPSETRDEIALNPAHFGRPAIEVMSTLAHEIVHLWQHHFGKPGRGGYHNEEWAREMERIGLTPSSTGTPPGKRTGERMSHFITPGGSFEQACTAYLAAEKITLFKDCDFLTLFSTLREGASDEGKAELDARLEKVERDRVRKAASKTKFTCPRCKKTNAWAVATAKFLCGGEYCDQEVMVPATIGARGADFFSEKMEEETP